ncbi:unnamed protein product [Cylicocyclus nassatus]|uniref:Uncharacterized protein n=1 Tax=Cylicocyclus nassatus TaxID=53992 RepID=A0AA36H1H3_CYLNA|nr:unnamed protein product [Cylicocyclus nassatus]
MEILNYIFLLLTILANFSAVNAGPREQMLAYVHQRMAYENAVRRGLIKRKSAARN